MQMRYGQEKIKSDISLLLVVNRRHSVGRLGWVGGDEGLTADRLFLGFCAAAIVNLSKQSGE